MPTRLHAADQDLTRGQSNAETTTAAQRPWEIEIHAGVMNGSGPMQGAGTLPPPRPPIVVPGFSNSTANFPSWYLGNGAEYLNRGLPISGGGMVALDPVLTVASATRRRGGSFGLKVSRRIASRLRAEGSVEHSLGDEALTRATRDRIESPPNSKADCYSRRGDVDNSDR